MKALIASIAIASLTAVTVGTAALAADTGSISATVTASFLALTVTDGGITYGTVATTADTTSAGVNDTQAVQNVGTVNFDLEIKGYSTTGNVWTLGAAGGDATYAHKTCIATCDSTPTWTATTTGWTDVTTVVTPTSTVDLDLQVTVPTANQGTGVATIPVDIRATTP